MPDSPAISDAQNGHRASRNPAETYSPLVIRFGAFGDMILLIPVLKLLSERYGRPCEVISSGPWTEPLLSRVPAASRRFLLTSRRAPYWFNRSQRDLVAWLRQRPTGPVYVFEPDDKSHWLLDHGWINPDMICTLRDLPRQPGEHILAHALRLAGQTPLALRPSHGGTVQPPAPDARPALTEADRSDCSAWLARHHLADVPLVLIQPGNKKTMKGGNRRRASNVDYWSEANWAGVITGVRRNLPSAGVIVCGSPAERPLAEDIVGRLPDAEGVLIATDDLPIPRLLALQERAHSMISVNTGPAHAAAAMGCPLVVMFARSQHRSADLYAPQPTTGPVRILQPDDRSPDARLASITPETVVAAWSETISHRPSAGAAPSSEPSARLAGTPH